MKAVVKLVCWRGLLALVPVEALKAERVRSKIWPERKMSSPRGMGKLTNSVEPELVRSVSWARKLPKA
jgi:hypothetical protein